jgi:hypothetical protein
MRVRLELPCQWCKTRREVDVELSATWWEWTCPECQAPNSLLTSTEFTIGRRVLARATEEYLSRADYTMTIILSAMAFEAEMARLFVKWTYIDALKDALVTMTVPDDEAIEEGYRRLGRTVADKIEAVAKLMNPNGIDAFVAGHELGQRIGTEFPSLNVGSLAADLQRGLFWPRNRILHAGFTGYTKEDAIRCYNIALMGISILLALDQDRRSR